MMTEAHTPVRRRRIVLLGLPAWPVITTEAYAPVRRPSRSPRGRHISVCYDDRGLRPGETAAETVQDQLDDSCYDDRGLRPGETNRLAQLREAQTILL